MDFGRIKEIAAVDYALPQDHKTVKKILGGKRTEHPSVYVGGVLWSSENFKGLIYPEKTKPADYAKYYLRQFNTIELNVTHYRTPEPERIKQWYKLAQPGFKFCPKVHQSISHAENLLSMATYHNACEALYTLFQEKLGVCFLQLPPYFSPARSKELYGLLEKSRPGSLAVELRYEAWFSEEAVLNELCNHLYRNNMSLILTDTPGRRDVLHMRLTSKCAFIRFNANNDPVSDKARIDDWVERAGTWFNNGLETFYFFVHCPDQEHMPQLVHYFITRLRMICGIRLEAPVIQQQDLPENTLF